MYLIQRGVQAGVKSQSRSASCKLRDEKDQRDVKDSTNSEKKKSSAAHTQHPGLTNRSLIHWQFYLWRKIFPAGEVEMNFICYCSIMLSLTGLFGYLGIVSCTRWEHWADGQSLLGFLCEAVQMADWSTVTLVPSMRFSFCPSIRGSHWLKFFSNPEKIQEGF